MRLPVQLASTRPDLLFVPGHSVPFAWTGRALAVVHDLAYERHPEAYSAAERIHLRLTTRWAVSRCRVLVAVSESTKNDLVSLYGADAGRIRVVPNGGGEKANAKAASASELGRLGLTGDFVLQVGRVEARKNQIGALAAVERIPGLVLAVAGPEADSAIAARLRRSDACRVLGRVDDATLELLYKRAKAVVVPSLYEGFGIPVLEAMTLGVPVVASDRGALPEVLGDAGPLVDPDADGALASAIEHVIDDEAYAAACSSKGVERSRLFSWDRMARGVYSAYQQAIERRCASA